MKIIDFRYRPSTRASLDSVIKNPVYCEYIKKTDFCSRPEKSLPECIDELRGLDIAKAVVSGRDIESTYAIQSTAIDAAMAHCAVDDAKFYPLYAMCCEFDIPVIMTAGLSPFMPKVVLDSTDPRHIDRVATDFPELKILLSHGGYPWVLEAIALVLRHSNVYMDFSTCESKLMGQNYIQAANEYITDKVVFASANPFVEVHKAVEKYQRLDLTEECRRKLFYENGMKLLGLSSL